MDTRVIPNCLNVVGLCSCVRLFVSLFTALKTQEEHIRLGSHFHTRQSLNLVLSSSKMIEIYIRTPVFGFWDFHQYLIQDHWTKV